MTTLCTMTGNKNNGCKHLLRPIYHVTHYIIQDYLIQWWVKEGGFITSTFNQQSILEKAAPCLMSSAELWICTIYLKVWIQMSKKQRYKKHTGLMKYLASKCTYLWKITGVYFISRFCYTTHCTTQSMFSKNGCGKSLVITFFFLYSKT